MSHETVVVVCPPPARPRCPMNAKLTTGFGVVTVSRDGQIIWQGDPEWEQAPTLMRFENAARKKPGIWTVNFLAPLQEREYQREGRNDWRLTKTGMGFA